MVKTTTLDGQEWTLEPCPCGDKLQPTRKVVRADKSALAVWREFRRIRKDSELMYSMVVNLPFLIGMIGTVGTIALIVLLDDYPRLLGNYHDLIQNLQLTPFLTGWIVGVIIGILRGAKRRRELLALVGIKDAECENVGFPNDPRWCHGVEKKYVLLFKKRRT